MKICLKEVGTEKEAAYAKFNEILNKNIKDLENDLKVKIEDYKVEQIDYVVSLKIKGEDEYQGVFVDPFPGFEEVHQTNFNMSSENQETNKDESFNSEYAVMDSHGVEKIFPTIESVLESDDELTLLNESMPDKNSSFVEKTYEHKDGSIISRIYQENKLIDELIAKPKLKQ